MKRYFFLYLLTVTLLTNCRTTQTGASSAKSHEPMTDAQFYDKMAAFLTNWPCVQSASHTGNKFTLVWKSNDSQVNQKCATSIKAAETAGQVDVVEAESTQTQLVLIMHKVSGKEIVADYMAKLGSACIESVKITDKGFDVKVRASTPQNAADHATCLNLVGAYFKVQEQPAPNNIILSYVTKPFICRTEDGQLTIETYKDYGVADPLAAMMDVASFALVKEGDQVVAKLEHCDLNVLDTDPPQSTVTCESIGHQNGSANYKHVISMGYSTLTIGNQKKNTRCGFPGMGAP
jgi:hypothetical protein